MRTIISFILASIFIVTSTYALAGDDMILVRSSANSPDEVIDAIKTYAEGKKWVYMGANKVKPVQGEVALVKVCIPEVAKLLWPLGLQVSAILPCGNFGVYKKEGKTEIAMLHPRYMQMLYPHPDVEKASAIAAPLFIDMLESVTKSATPVSTTKSQ